MRVIEGDLIKLANEGHFDIIVHGCNCFNNFGAGIAKQIRHVWPNAFKSDLRTVKGDPNKLGTYTTATVDANGNSLLVINAYTQYRYGTRERNVDYEALRKVFETISETFHGSKIGIPLIGGGYAGGDHQLLLDIFEETMANVDITLVLFEPKRLSPTLANRITN